MTKRDKTQGQQKPEHPHSDALCMGVRRFVRNGQLHGCWCGFRNGRGWEVDRGSENEMWGLQKPEHPRSGVSCVMASAGAVFEMAGDGKWMGVPKMKCGGCRSLNTQVVVFCAWIFGVSCVTTSASVVFETVGDGKWVPKMKCGG